MPTAIEGQRRRKLLGPEKAFVIAYCTLGTETYLSASNAARAAGLANPEASGSRLLQRKRIRAAIDRRLAKRLPGPREVAGEIADIAMSPWRDHLRVSTNADGEVLSVRLDLGAKVRCLEMLAKHEGLLLDPLQRALAGMLEAELARYIGGRKVSNKRKAREAHSQLRKSLKAGTPEHDASRQSVMTHDVIETSATRLPLDPPPLGTVPPSAQVEAKVLPPRPPRPPRR